MKKVVIISILAVLIIIGVIMCLSDKELNFSINSENESSAAVPDPAGLYCLEMGYEGKTLTNEKGEYGVCVFPDNSACDVWEFFRGKCEQERSYCEQQGYDIKDLGQNEGWFKGGICIEKTSGEEVGNIYDLMKLGGEKENSSEIITGGITVGVADLSTIYCIKMGYKIKLLYNENGEYAVCVLPDKTECDSWAFFRGKCEQEWSYCEQQGYDIKDLRQNEGWFKGGICINENKEKVDSLYNLMNLSSEVGCKI